MTLDCLQLMNAAMRSVSFTNEYCITYAAASTHLTYTVSLPYNLPEPVLCVLVFTAKAAQGITYYLNIYFNCKSIEGMHT